MEALEKAPFVHGKNVLFYIRGVKTEKQFELSAKDAGREVQTVGTGKDSVMIAKSDLILAFPNKKQSPKKVRKTVTTAATGKFVDTIIYPDTK